MEKKIYIMEHLGCANCAAKMEAKFNAHPGVQEATVTFATKQLRLTAENPDALIPELQALARTVEGDIVIVPRDGHHGHHHECGCGHDHHEHHHECGCGHDHHEHHHECGCGHDHHEHEHECGCGHDHHEHHHECGCGHDHHEHHHECGCGHDHHEHDHECGCGHDHHEHHHECGCGHDHHEHEHEHECGCGHDHHEHHHECGCGHDHHEHHHDHGPRGGRVYIMENLGCANCAAKMEAKFNAHPGVESATITFATKQLRLKAEDPDALIPALQELARTVEGNIVIVPRDGHKEEHTCGGHGHECTCGHDHGEEKAAEKAAPEKMPEQTVLAYGAVLFAAGLILSHFGVTGLSFLCCVIAYVMLGREVVTTAAKNLVKGHVFDENFLMSVATLGAFLIGEAPEAVGVMLFYRVGEFFEHRAVERSRSQIMEAVDLRPETVNLLVRGKVRVTPAERVQPGALVLVRPGDRIPLDGVVVSGESRIDTAPITGEPVPAHVAEGDSVTSGCINTVGQLTVRVEKPLSESMVTRILDSVENAAASKPKIDRFITRFARIYTPIVVALAAATAIIPSLVTGNWSHWIYTALTFLVMSCPCALVLSVPLAFFAGIGVGSKKGILFKGGQSMEAMGAVKAVVMDKTGTLTKGDFTVQKVEGGDELLALCASCEQQSTHPIAASITAAAREKGLTLKNPESLEELAGQGIKAQVDGKTVLCGNARLLEENGVAFESLADHGTVVLVAVDGTYAGFILIADSLKAGSKDAIRTLKTAGYATFMLTGDSAETAEAVADELAMDGVHAGLLPHQKLERLQSIRQETGGVMFVGDGINDAPVLAGADVGAAMGSGADAAIEAADVVFMTSDPAAIPQALDIAKKTLAVAWQNVVFALAIKFAVMVLGLFGFASMWLAVFADSGVAMLCVLNSIRMLYKKNG